MKKIIPISVFIISYGIAFIISHSVLQECKPEIKPEIKTEASDRYELQLIKDGVTNMPPGYTILNDGNGHYAIKTADQILLDGVFSFTNLSFAPIRAWRIKQIEDGMYAQIADEVKNKKKWKPNE